jgi:hypothetical protein
MRHCTANSLTRNGGNVKQQFAAAATTSSTAVKKIAKNFFL